MGPSAVRKGVLDLNPVQDRAMEDMMDNEESMEFLRKQQGNSDPHRARFNETISKIESILKRTAASQGKNREAAGDVETRRRVTEKPLALVSKRASSRSSARLSFDEIHDDQPGDEPLISPIRPPTTKDR